MVGESSIIAICSCTTVLLEILVFFPDLLKVFRDHAAGNEDRFLERDTLVLYEKKKKLSRPRNSE